MPEGENGWSERGRAAGIEQGDEELGVLVGSGAADSPEMGPLGTPVAAKVLHLLISLLYFHEYLDPESFLNLNCLFHGFSLNRPGRNPASSPFYPLRVQ
jgi:hypothetical protein